MAETTATRPQDRIPTRSEVPASDTWDLSKLYPDDQAWEQGLAEFTAKIPEIAQFKGTLGSSAGHLFTCLDFMTRLGMLDERLGYYAHLRLTEDAGDSKNQERFGRYMQAATRMETEASYQAPEIQAIPEETMAGFLADALLTDYRIYLNKLLRFKPHVLSEREERLLAMQEEANQTASRSFGALTDVDMEFGSIETPEGERTLSQASYNALLQHTDRNVRKAAFDRFMGVFESHKNTLTNLYSGSVHLDIYKAKARNFPSSRAAHLFPDDVPQSVYDNLIQAVTDNLGPLHRYYGLRRKALGLEKLHLYDTKVPLIGDVKVHHKYEQAVDVIYTALAPLGEEYRTTLKEGLLGGWVDRYENKGKRSGAFSAGSFVGNPYILMNFKEDDLRDVFTLAHEGGHSMHSWYSTRNNPFQHYHYTIFEAEVASTFNEQLLLDHFLAEAKNDGMKAYLVNKHVDDIIATLYRQTMFAEFEHITHQMVEEGRPLSVDALRSEYRKLLEKYFGPEVEIDAAADMEGLRIPHFYRAFYVYKYATGISAAITLAQRVTSGGKKELEDYFAFLKSGGSRYPIESLKVAGVDMTAPAAVETALARFAARVDELEGYL